MSVTCSVSKCLTQRAFEYYLNYLKSNNATGQIVLTDSEGNTYYYDANIVYPSSTEIQFIANVSFDTDKCIKGIEVNVNISGATYTQISISCETGIVFKANKTYIVTVTESVECSSSVTVPAPDGTC